MTTRVPDRLSGLAGLLVTLAVLPAATPVQGQDWRTVTASRRVTSEKALDVHVAYGSGRLQLLAGESDLLYRMHLRYDAEAFRPVSEVEDGRVRLGVESVGKNIRIARDGGGGEMEVSLNPRVPTRLRLQFGAARADLDLGGMSLTDLRLTTGASETRLDVSRPNRTEMGTARLEAGAADFAARHLGNLNAERIEVSAGVGDVTLAFTGEWRRDASVSVEMGLGSLELRVPEGLGLKLEEDTFLTSLDTQELVKRGDAYYSLDWEEAEHRIVVEVDAAFGSVDVVWVR